MTAHGAPGPTVAFHPLATRTAYARLIQALARVFGLRPVPLDLNALHHIDGVVVFGHDPAVVEAVERAGVRLYLVDDRAVAHGAADHGAADHGADHQSEGPGVVTFSGSPSLNPHLRGRRIGDDGVAAAPALAGGALDEVLASVDGRPIWGRRNRGATDVVSLPPPALDGTASLGQHLTTGCFAALLPLVQYLRDLTAEGAWTPPPLRATIVLDDPNLLSLSYGWLRYPELLALARAHDFHVSIATVPLDTWLTRPGPQRLLAANADRLSVSIHGNNHVHHELAQPLGVDHYLALLAQARRRMDRMTAHGLAYDLVQIPPHNQCGSDALAAMARLGYEAVTVTPPYRERAGFDDPVATGGFGPADLSPEGFPVLVRRHLGEPYDDYPLRAFLGAPIVLYGHHEDSVQGSALLVNAAAAVNDLGPVQWLSLAGIMRSNHLSRRDGDLLRIRPYSRRLHVAVPDGVRRLEVELPADHPLGQRDQVTIGSTAAALQPDGGVLRAGGVAVSPGATTVVELRHPDHVDYRTVPGQRPGPWPVSRRMLVQVRDRGRPVMEKVRARHG